MALALAAQAADLFFTRWTPDAGGPYPMRVVSLPGNKSSYEVEREPGRPEVFKTSEKFFTAVHGPDYAPRKWTIDRYLGKGRYTPTEANTSLVIVGPMEPTIALPNAQDFILLGQAVIKPLNEKALTLARRVRKRRKNSCALTRPLTSRPGVDIKNRSKEIAKLLYAGFHSWIFSAGYDFEDVLQEVYRKILVSNHGTRPWDPSKSSFGHYVHLICRSALSNFHRKQARVRSREQLGYGGLTPDGGWADLEVSTSQRAIGRHGLSHPTEDNPVVDLQRYITTGPLRRHPLAPMACAILPYVQDGHTLKDTAAMLKVERTQVSKAMKLLRECAASWQG